MIATRNLYDKVELEIRTLTESKHVRSPGVSLTCGQRADVRVAESAGFCGCLQRWRALVPHAGSVGVFQQ